jgi:hypothetical protein
LNLGTNWIPFKALTILNIGTKGESLKKVITISALLIFATGCAKPTKLNENGLAVKMGKNDPAKECQEIGFIKGNSSNFVKDYEENARNKMRNEAAVKGANYIRLETAHKDSNGVVYEGTAFKCP